MIDVEGFLVALERETQTQKLEAEHMAEYDLVPLSPAWLLAAFKLIMADTLYRVAKAVREGPEG